MCNSNFEPMVVRLFPPGAVRPHFAGVGSEETDAEGDEGGDEGAEEGVRACWHSQCFGSEPEWARCRLLRSFATRLPLRAGATAG